MICPRAFISHSHLLGICPNISGEAEVQQELSSSQRCQLSSPVTATKHPKTNTALSSSAPKGCSHCCLFLGRPEHDPTCICYTFTRWFRVINRDYLLPVVIPGSGCWDLTEMGGIGLSGEVFVFHSSSRMKRKSSKTNLPNVLCLCPTPECQWSSAVSDSLFVIHVLSLCWD